MSPTESQSADRRLDPFIAADCRLQSAAVRAEEGREWSIDTESQVNHSTGAI